MRPRECGGFEPDDQEQVRLVNLWHLSRTALSHLSWRLNRTQRIEWVVDTFCSENPLVTRGWIYRWCVDRLGSLFDAR